MPPDDQSRRERAYELLALRTSEPLSALETAELEHLLAELPEVDPDELDRIAAELILAEVGEQTHPALPDRLRAQVEADAATFFALGQPGPEADPTPANGTPRFGGFEDDPEPPSDVLSGSDVAGAPLGGGAPGGVWTVMPWVVAAAAAVVAVVAANRPATVVTEVREVEVPVEVPPPAPPPAPTPKEARAQFLAANPDRIVIAFGPGPDATGAEVGGNVVWSDAAQEGFMQLDGLAVNDPTVEQYQLWIFDAGRDDAHPVDGGVFDVSETGQVVVPIDAKLPVTSPTLFAVTVEAPGGVVVSTRERIAALAKPTPI